MVQVLLLQVSDGDVAMSNHELKQRPHGHAYQQALEFQRAEVYRDSAQQNTHRAQSLQ